MQGRGRDFAPATSECPPITYASHMDILLTHTSALEAMRLPEFPLLVKRWGDDAAELPDRIPKVSELRGILESDPLVQRLSRPIELLVASDATAHSCHLFTRHVTRLSHPGNPYLRIGEKVLVVCPELVALQGCRKASRVEGALLMSELCGTYAMRAPGIAEQRQEPLVAKREIVRTVNLMCGSHGTRRAREAIPLACELAASPAESKLAALIQAPPSLGGYGLRATPPSDVGLEPLWCERARSGCGGGILLLRPYPLFESHGSPTRGVVIRIKTEASPTLEELDEQDEGLQGLGLETVVITEHDASDPSRLDDLVRDVRDRLGMVCVPSAGQREKRLELLSELERVTSV